MNVRRVFTRVALIKNDFVSLVDFSGLEPSPQISGMQVDRPLCHRQDRINTVTTHSERYVSGISSRCPYSVITGDHRGRDSGPNTGFLLALTYRFNYV